MGPHRATLATLAALSVLAAGGVCWDLVRVGATELGEVAAEPVGGAPLEIVRDLSNKATHGWLIRQDQISESLPRVRSVTMHGNVYASDASLRHLADVRDGALLYEVDLDRVIEGVTSHPWVVQASVSRGLTGEIKIDVVEHRPVMLLAHDGLYRVSDKGVIFARAHTGGAGLDYPILTGLDADLIDEHARVGERVVREALRALASVEDRPALADDGVDVAAVSEVHFDRDLGFTLKLRDGSQLRMGFSDPLAGLGRLEAMFSAGLALDTPQDIDLDLDGMATATPRVAPRHESQTPS